MEKALMMLLEKVPVAAAVIITVWLFLKQQRLLSKQWGDTVEKMGKDGVKCQEDCTKAVIASTKILGRVAGLIDIRIKQENGE